MVGIAKVYVCIVDDPSPSSGRTVSYPEISATFLQDSTYLQAALQRRRMQMLFDLHQLSNRCMRTMLLQI